MGWVNYVVSPLLKAMFQIPRSITELPERFVFPEDEDTVDVMEWTPDNLKNVRLDQIGDVIKFYRQFAYDSNLETKIFILELARYDKDVWIVSEMDEPAMDKLKKEGYRVME